MESELSQPSNAEVSSDDTLDRAMFEHDALVYQIMEHKGISYDEAEEEIRKTKSEEEQ